MLSQTIFRQVEDNILVLVGDGTGFFRVKNYFYPKVPVKAVLSVLV